MKRIDINKFEEDLKQELEYTKTEGLERFYSLNINSYIGMLQHAIELCQMYYDATDAANSEAQALNEMTTQRKTVFDHGTNNIKHKESCQTCQFGGRSKDRYPCNDCEGFAHHELYDTLL